MAPQRFYALLEAVRAFKSTINDGAPANCAVSIFPAHHDVQHEVQGPKRFEAFRLAPYVDEAGCRDQLVDQVKRLGPWPQVRERHDLEAKLLGGFRRWGFLRARGVVS